MKKNLHTTSGPFRADQIRTGDPYELSNGHAIYCLPTGGRGSRANLLGGQVLESDPDVESAGVDTGFSPAPDTLRAPDVAVGNVADEPGWVQGVPPLAVEYADSGQDETELADKISELLAAGTRFIWVVRLTGPRRVEVHEAGKAVRLAVPGEELRAPGILRNPVPVLSLYDRDAAHEATLRNLLQRRGYGSVEAIRREGGIAALQEALLLALDSRGWDIPEELRAAVDACNDPELLKAWLRRAVTATSVLEIF